MSGDSDTRRREIISATREYVREIHAGDTSGHDWWHVARVWRVSDQLAEIEGADRFVTSLIALLHDIDDHKLSDMPGGLLRAGRWLQRQELGEQLTTRILDGIRQVSFSANGTRRPDTLEAQVVQDADRLDALGAIGIARAFAYGGYIGQPLHDSRPWANDGRRHGYDTTSHIREKLLVLGAGMNTEAGRELAADREAYVRDFLERFLAEWSGSTAKGAAQ